MAKIIIVIVLAVVLFISAAAVKSSMEKDKLREKEYKKAVATIKKTMYSETGNVRYYVTFSDKGKEVVAETHYYSSSTKSLNPGDEVEIGYYYIEDMARAVIYDDRVVPCAKSVGGFYIFLNAGGAVLLAAAIFELVKKVGMQ